MKRTVLLLIILIAASVSAQKRLTFEKAISLALAQNHQVKIARNNAEIAANKTNIGNAGLLPGLSLSGNTSYQEGGAYDDGGSLTTNGSVAASYTLFDGFGNIYRFRKLFQQGG